MNRNITDFLKIIMVIFATSALVMDIISSISLVIIFSIAFGLTYLITGG